MAIASGESTTAKEEFPFYKTNGKISDCRLLKCPGECCDFESRGYTIILPPGELQAAHDSGLSTDHLRIVDDNYHGGQRAVCVAHNKINCDRGYKPYDCFFYPLFPAADKATGTITFIADPRCKLVANGCDLSDQIVKTEKLVASLVQRDPTLIDFFAKDDPQDWIPVAPRKKARPPGAGVKRCAFGND